MENPYCPIEAKITDVIEETPTIKTVAIKPHKPISFETGQFMELAVPGLGEAPFTPSSNPTIQDNMELTIMDVGKVTSQLHKMRKGDAVGVRGPGGGVGLAPLRSLILALFNDIDKYEKVVIKYGARTPKDIVYKNEINKWGKNKKTEVELTVDAGDEAWKGHVGLITTLLKKNMGVDIGKSVAVVCGPPIMMKFATFKLLDLGYKDEDIYLSMEKNMSCGIGKCGHCRIGPYYACKDGPVFTYDKVKGYHTIWE
jgi:NAD(P)H-flavin reductase